MKNSILSLIPVALLAFTGCNNLVDQVDNYICSVVPYYVADCNDPEVREKAVSVLTNGVIDAQITCQGIAINSTGTKFASVYYTASKLQDGSCFSAANVTGPATSGGGFVQSVGAGLTARSDSNADSCPVKSFHVPMLQSITTVQSGVIDVESPFCSGVCSMLVEGNCTGFGLNKF